MPYESISENESILTSIKGLLGIPEDSTHFDLDVIVHINGALSALSQFCVGPRVGFLVTDKTQTWQDYIGDRNDLQMVIPYVFLKVKLVFDPPTNSFLVQAMNDQIKEYEFRLSVI